MPFQTSLRGRLLDRRSGRRRTSPSAPRMRRCGIRGVTSKAGGTWAVPLPVQRRRLRDVSRMRPSAVRAALARAAAEGSGMKVTLAKVSSTWNWELEKQ